MRETSIAFARPSAHIVTAWHMVPRLLSRSAMEERRMAPERRMTDRRTTDQGPERPDEYLLETRREVNQLRKVIQTLIDAVQALTASRSKYQ